MRFLILTAVAVLILGGVAYFEYRTPVYGTGEFSGVSLNIEYALTKETRERGLSDRGEMPANSAMLFVFPAADRHGFWMKDMLFSIDIFWFDDQGQVIWITEDVSPATYPSVFYPPKPVHYVLEAPAGFATSHNIDIGAQLHLQSWPIVSE
ncbi:hypothetical protein A3H77_00660 [Candidatus Kaiserbacteria bacterium RIFCSPLOWO2_02_FULL_56_11]|nr:MAG: hypothetical protein A3H77_00660 [Candidatus Kaiserbacteria bacterium RIFCSPLOWO2_02_FULL_56_11]